MGPYNSPLPKTGAGSRGNVRRTNPTEGATMRYSKAVVGVVSLAAWSVVAAGATAGQTAARSAAPDSGSLRLLVPHDTWTCGMPGGIPGPESGTLLFTAVMPLDRLADIGRTQYGRRQVAVSQEGTLTGARLTGTVMTGGLDFELTLANGVV